MSDDPASSAEFPDRLLDQVLADPEATKALGDFAHRRGITTPLADMTRRELRLLAGALMAEARDRQYGGPAPTPPPPSDLADRQIPVPDELLQSIFEDPRASDVLTDLALANGWSDPPAKLPDHVKRDFVRILIDQGIVSFEEPRQT